MTRLGTIFLVAFYIFFVIVAINNTNKRDRKLDEVYKACAPVVDSNNEVICTK